MCSRLTLLALPPAVTSLLVHHNSAQGHFKGFPQPQPPLVTVCCDLFRILCPCLAFTTLKLQRLIYLSNTHHTDVLNKHKPGTCSAFFSALGLGDMKGSKLHPV